MNDWRSRELGRQGKTPFLAVLLGLMLVIYPIIAHANGQETCPQSGGWVKVDNLSGQSYTYTPPAGYHVTDNCYKAGQSVVFGSGATVTSSVLNPQGRCCQALSHASFLVVPDPTDVPPPATATPEPTATDVPPPTDIPTEESTDEPTQEPTEEPTTEPTAEPTQEPTAEPTQEPTATATDAPKPDVEVQRLPSTGDGLSAETWLCWGTNVYCAHNGVDGSEGELWVFLYKGATVTFQGQTYVVERIERVTPQVVSVLDDAADYDVVLLTCSSYIGGAWVNRVVIFANLVDA